MSADDNEDLILTNSTDIVNNDDESPINDEVLFTSTVSRRVLHVKS